MSEAQADYTCHRCNGVGCTGRERCATIAELDDGPDVDEDEENIPRDDEQDDELDDDAFRFPINTRRRWGGYHPSDEQYVRY